MEVKELIKKTDKLPKINGIYKVSKVGQKYCYNKDEDKWSQKYSLIDENQTKDEPHLTLTVFAEEYFDYAAIGDKVKIENALYEPRKGNNGIMYYNLSLGRFGKMSIF
jgi:hypothetical protein